MTPNRPYLLRALFEWICDNDCTPYLLVDATLEGVEVPFEHVTDGRIVLNASGTAVANFDVTNEAVSFSTRFSGRDTWINVPMAAVLAIYSKETQDGMTFPPTDYPDSAQRPDLVAASGIGVSKEAPAKRQNVEVKTSDASADKQTVAQTKSEAKPQTKSQTKPQSKSKKGGSHLKVIK